MEPAGAARTPPELQAVAEHFQVEGRWAGAVRIPGGHINDTYKLSYATARGPVHYILQRINHHVFRQPGQLMENIRRVTGHLEEKIKAEGAAAGEETPLRLIPARSGGVYCRLGENYWRLYNFIGNGVSRDELQSPAQAREAARAFGKFQRRLSDLPGPPLHETIPRFHHTPGRYAAFEKAAAEDPLGRAAAARTEADFARRRQSMTSVLLELRGKGAVPERITHNDTKINNVMLHSRTVRAVCVIDLDTVMSGLALYDFGDLMRTAASAAAEDERDLAKIRLRPEYFEALVRGYLEGADGFLNEMELRHLVFSGKLITFETGLRFLTDYLRGDIYFKIRRPEHNLERARAQFKLVSEMEKSENALRRIAEKHARAGAAS